MAIKRTILYMQPPALRNKLPHTFVHVPPWEENDDNHRFHSRDDYDTPHLPGLVGVRIRDRFNCVREIVKIVKKNVNSKLGRMLEMRNLAFRLFRHVGKGPNRFVNLKFRIPATPRT